MAYLKRFVLAASAFLALSGASAQESGDANQAALELLQASKDHTIGPHDFDKIESLMIQELMKSTENQDLDFDSVSPDDDEEITIAPLSHLNVLLEMKQKALAKGQLTAQEREKFIKQGWEAAKKIGSSVLKKGTELAKSGANAAVTALRGVANQSVNALKAAAGQLWEKNKEMIQQFLRSMVGSAKEQLKITFQEFKQQALAALLKAKDEVVEEFRSEFGDEEEEDFDENQFEEEEEEDFGIDY